MPKQDCLSLHKPDGFENPCLEKKENYEIALINGLRRIILVNLDIFG